MYNQNILAKRMIYLMISSFLSFIYIYIYINIPNEYLRDRGNYILYAKDVDYFLTRYDGVDVFFNEPIFLYLNKFLSNYFIYDSIPIIFVFINTSIMVFLLLKYSKNLTFFVLGLIFIVVFPYTFQAQIIALRQSLATSLFLISFLNLLIYIFLVVLTAFFTKLFISGYKSGIVNKNKFYVLSNIIVVFKIGLFSLVLVLSLSSFKAYSSLEEQTKTNL